MFYILKNKIANNNSFIKAYHFWTNALIIAVIINFLFFRTLFLNIEENSFFYLINYIIEYGIFLAFFLLLFYKFYNYLFNFQILDGILGIIFLIFGVLKLYISDINIYNITELLFFIFTFLITIKTILPLILLKNINELQRGVYIFILISLGFSNLNYIILSANKIIDNDIMHYISLYLIEYMGKVSSISFIIIMIGYIIIFAKRMIKKNIYKYFIFILVFTIVFILKSKYSNHLIIISFYLQRNFLCGCFSYCYYSAELSFAVWSAMRNASTISSMLPFIKLSILYSVSPMRWSVTRPCGKLYVRMRSLRSPVPT